MQRVKYSSEIFRAEMIPPWASSNDNVSLNVTRQIHYVSRFREAHVAYEPGIKICTCSVAPLRLTIDGRKSSTTVSLFMRRDAAAVAMSRRKLSGRAISLQQQIVARMGKGGGHMTRFPRISLHATSPGESPTFAHPFSSPRQTFRPKLSFFRRSGCDRTFACAIA